MSDYELTDSDSDYEENEKILLKNFRKNKHDSPEESEEEIFNVGADEDDDDDIDLAESDVEDQENDGLPSDKAWGKKKKTFYSTDYVDPDYGGFDEKDMQLAEMEGEEAKKLQIRLAEQLDDDDFVLDFVPEDTEKVDNEIVEKIIKTDPSKFSKEEKIQFLKRDSPELFSLMKDFTVKMKIYKTFLKPVLMKYRKGQLSNSSAMDFVETFSQLILNYCTNIYMFILLKANRESVNNHPVVKRLYQYRQLLGKLDTSFEKTVKPQITAILEEKEILELPKEINKKKKLKILEKLLPSKSAKKEEKPLKEKISENDIPELKEPENPINEEIDEVGKRAITYQIAKNKGLTPHRKKEQRNPRVKHRNAFRKAKIRRKGAVREVRTEVKRYGGEISGIKASVTKSIKIKS